MLHYVKLIEIAAIVLVLWIGSCIVMVVVARRLPPGLLRDAAEFLPVIGPLDDVVAVVLLLRYAARAVPRELLFEAWPAQRRLLERLLLPT